MEMQILKEKREENKEKVLLDEAYDIYGEPDEEDEKVPRKRPRTRGLKRALEWKQQKEQELVDELTLNDKFSIMINENRENWFERVNNHLENLLEKENKYNDI